jgi:hypothetical protein
MVLVIYGEKHKKLSQMALIYVDFAACIFKIKKQELDIIITVFFVNIAA